MNRLIIIGASGHGKVVADVARYFYKDIVFLDNNPDLSSCIGYSVLGPDTMIANLDGDVFVAIGNNNIRKNLMEREAGRKFPVLVHPSAVLVDGVEIGGGTVIMAGAVINPGARIGKGCIVNTSSSIDHDCVIEDFVHVSVGAHLSGTVKVGRGTWIGAGVTVSNNVDICPNTIIGTGAVVIHSIEEAGTYVGVPAKKMLKN